VACVYGLWLCHAYRYCPRVMGGVRLRTRWSTRTGTVTVVLIAGTSSAALGLALAYHLGVAQTLVAVLVGGGAPAGVYLAWATYRLSVVQGSEADSAKLSRIADALAIAVSAQWQAEALVRRLHDPYPLPVRWEPADASLVAIWDELVATATSGLGWPAPPPPGGWALGPRELAGSGDELVDVLARVPTGRMVVLGEPGSGKSMLMVRLVLDMLERRKVGEPVPVLVGIASWDPTTEELRGWLQARLSIDYPALADPVSMATGTTTGIDALLRRGLIIPILDGLDEIPDALRGPAVARINDAVRPGEQIVVTCRTAAYKTAVRPTDGIEVTLRAAAGIGLRPLDSHTVADYLRADTGGPSAAARWEPVLGALITGGPLGLVLSNPLMAGLARAIYNPRPHEQIRPLPNPAELCDFSDASAIEQHLFDAFIPSVYRPELGAARPLRRAQKAGKWLSFLASHLERDTHGSDLAWWQLRKATPRWVTGVAAAITTGLAVILAIEAAFFVLGVTYFGLTRGLGAGIKLGVTGLALGSKFVPLLALLAALVAGVTTILTDETAQYSRFISPRRPLTISIISGLVFGLMAGIVFWELVLGSTGGLVVGILSGITAAIATAVAQKRGAKLRFREGSLAAIVVGIVTGVTLGVLVGYFSGRSSGIQVGIAFGAIAFLTTGVVVIITGADHQRPSRRLRWNVHRGAFFGVMALLVAGLAVGYSVPSGQKIPDAIASGLAFGLAGAIVVGMQAIPDDSSTAASPKATLIRDRSTTFVLALLTGVAGALAAGLVIGPLYGEGDGVLANFSIAYGGGFVIGLAFGLAAGISVGLGVAIVLGLTVSVFGSAWPQWIVARGWLTLRGRSPWQLMGFLSDAHGLGVLRQVGAVYQFRHIELQHRLGRPQTSQGGPVRSFHDVRVSSSRGEAQPDRGSVDASTVATRTPDPMDTPPVSIERTLPLSVTRPIVSTMRQIRHVLATVAVVTALAAAMEGALILAGASALSSRPHSLALSLPSVVTPRILPVEHVAATEHLKFQPWTLGRLSASERVVATASGFCVGTSEFSLRPDAYGCFVGNYYFDPCFANPVSFDAFFTNNGEVACTYHGPNNVLIIHLTAPLRYPSLADPYRYNSWLLVLMNGEPCYYFRKANAIEGERFSGFCDGGGHVYGNLIISNPVWKIYYRKGIHSTATLTPVAAVYS
jgi:NACHT domain